MADDGDTGGPVVHDSDPSRRVGFASAIPLAITQVDPTDWRRWATTAEMVYHGSRDTFVIPAGSETDGHSRPALLGWLVSRVVALAAAILHDRLWRHEIATGRVTYREADGLYRQALRSLGVPALRRYLMWAAVRWAALGRRGGYIGWWRDAPLVIAVSAAGVPIAAGAVLLLPGLALYWLLELVVSTPGYIRRRS